MSAWTAAAMVAIVAVMTYGMRAVVIVALAGRTIPPSVERALHYVGPAVLAALAVNLAAAGEGGEVGVSVPESVALLAAGLVAWRTRHALATVVTGMVVLWALSAV